jgi:hypothetical protein
LTARAYGVITVKPIEATVVQDLQNLQTVISQARQSTCENKNAQKTLNTTLAAVINAASAAQYRRAGVKQLTLAKLLDVRGTRRLAL